MQEGIAEERDLEEGRNKYCSIVMNWKGWGGETKHGTSGVNAGREDSELCEDGQASRQKRDWERWRWQGYPLE